MMKRLAMAPSKSRAEQLADTLSEHIIELGYAPGSHYSTLEQIRQEVGLARTTVSEAVRLLRERGVLEIRPGRGGGIFIAESTPSVRMRHTLLSVKGSATSIREAVELREALELPVAVGASMNCSESDATRLREAVSPMLEPAIPYSEFIRRNWRLHELISEINSNRMMSAVYVSCLGYLAQSSPQYSDSDAEAEYIRVRGAQHIDLVEVIVSGDIPRIQAAVEAHNRG